MRAFYKKIVDKGTWGKRGYDLMRFEEKKIIGFVSLAICLTMYLCVFFIGDSSILSYVVMLALITIAILFDNDWQFISPAVLFLAFYLYSVALGPIILMLRGTYYTTYDYHTTIIGGLLAFAIGNFFFSFKNTNVKSRGDKSHFQIKIIDRITVLYMLYLMTVLLSLFYIYQNYDLLFGGNIESSRVDAMSGNGALIYLMQSSIVILPMLFDIYYGTQKLGKPLINKYVLGFMIIFSAFLLLASGYRAPVMTLFICLIIMYAGKTDMKPLKIVAFGFLSIIGVTVLGVIRSALSGGSSSVVSSLLASLYTNGINLNYIFSTFPEKVPFQNGYTYLINFKMLMPGPDLDFTLWLKEQIGISFSGGGVTPTILGEFYMNFGFASIFIGMFILGVVSVYLRKYFIRHRQSFMAVFMTWQFAHCISGGIANVSITLLLYFCMYKVILWFPIGGVYNKYSGKAIGACNCKK
ncbi:MAG: oligosaccharide repeat unit polymerase [Bacteroides sp.]|nr:oligosaccharide repeat unit polymerase [Bacteroides sp.]